ncbi:glutathione peroxidase-like protein [Basidiobolus meristosporus CBS 931.73]|uniref:Glutathione peroxidase n=1 Tax=Basidiobolus meristosporus CBS 931.73 TaxID=1314790 RepID=A0A1Y1YBN8_9FUNG|nr:glutathione peroxidase-like protein [Basidiobolus meristosporus CBS 931.73]|eukprot:ORX95461.1 glutathione peroxidase-like protein [Basidiobolus meristosporus CBS 931.73]
MSTSAFYDLKANDKTHREMDFSTLKGKVVLIVNVASKCGFTPQYKALEAIYKQYKDRDFVILGFPCDQFGGQEPGNDEEISSFCELNFGVTFPLMEKVEVNGDHAHPVFEYIKQQKPGLLGMKRVKWNFEKFLIDRNGNVKSRYASTTKPESIAQDIESLLG